MDALQNVSNVNATDPSKEAAGSRSVLMSVTGAVIEAVLMVVICLGNVLVIMAFARNRRLRSGNNYFIMQLAIADFLVGLVMPMQIVAWVYPASLATPFVCMIRYSTLFLTLAASIISLLCLTIDRFVAISWPLTYSTGLSRWRVIFGALFVWMTAGLCGLMVQFYHVPVPGNHFDDPPNDCDMLKVIHPLVLIHAVANTFYVITIVIILIYIRILLLARKHARAMADQQKSQGNNQKKVEFKAARTAAVVLGTFYMCWLPLIITTTIQYYFGLEENSILMTCRAITSFIAILNSAINPIIYTFRMKEMKKEFKKIICRTPTSISPMNETSVTEVTIIKVKTDTD